MTTIALLMLDVDFFKRFNDTYGHQAGDGCVDLAGALSVAKSIRQNVERRRIAHGASAVSDVVTVSIGAAATVPRGGMVVASLVAAADAALYRAKQSGRDTVTAGMMETSPDGGSAATHLPRVRIHHPGS